MRKIFITLLLTLSAAFCFAQTEKSHIVQGGGSGPYKAMVAADASLPNFTIYRPQDLKAVDKLPVLLYANGGCANSTVQMRFLLNDVASHGYLVIATGYIPMEEEPFRGPMSTTQQQIESIDWAFAQNADPASPLFGKVDTKHVCAAGMSCGGLQTLFNCADPASRS